MRSIRFTAFFAALALVLAFAGQVEAKKDIALYDGAKKAKYVIFLIGDGLAAPQRTAAEMFLSEKAGKKVEMISNTLPAQGITTTYAADRFITGSAASATALGAGQKTNIGVVGMTPDHKPVKSIAHIAKEKGMKVGIVSSVSIDHATPAAFYAHVPARGQYHYIDHALPESGFDFFGGGGLKDVEGKRSGIEPRGNAMDKIKKAGYKVVTDKDEFMKLTPADGKILAYNAWLQDSGALPYHIDSRPDQDITIGEFTKKAIEMLDNDDKGFFLMVEAGKIDWACHANDATSAIVDTIGFEEAVSQAIDFYNEHPEDTLIVVTGDHECGGLTIGFAGTKYATYPSILGNQKMSYQQFTTKIVKPYKEEHGANANFHEFKDLITENFGLKFMGDAEKDLMVLTDLEKKKLQEAFNRTMGGETEVSDETMTALLYGGYDPVTVQVTHILNNKAGLAWTSYKHTGVPVPTSAMGLGSQTFNGYYDNTDVALKIMAIMGIEPKVHMADAGSEQKTAVAAK
jgi:alkaline phosphatase